MFLRIVPVFLILMNVQDLMLGAAIPPAVLPAAVTSSSIEDADHVDNGIRRTRGTTSQSVMVRCCMIAYNVSYKHISIYSVRIVNFHIILIMCGVFSHSACLLSFDLSGI